MKRHILNLLACCILPVLFYSSCNSVVTGPGDKELDARILADKMEAKLKGNCVGYQFSIHYKGESKAFRAGGDARLSPDDTPRPMTNFDKYNVASVSKTITAAALMHILNAKGMDEKSTIGTYMPKHWNLSAKTKELTFEALLQHRSGFRTTYGSDYANLKKLFEEGPTNDVSPIYNNANYAIMRMLIANLNGAVISPVPLGSPAAVVQAIEETQAIEYTNAYMDYCQKNVFDKVSGCSNMACKPTDAMPGYCYQFPKDGGNGTDFGDMTLTNAERGWNINSLQLANFMSALHDKGAILPQAIADRMSQNELGYDWDANTTKGHSYFIKTGNYPGKKNDGTNWNPGELNAYVIGFGSGVRVSLIVNSQYQEGGSYVNPFNVVLSAYDEWYK